MIFGIVVILMLCMNENRLCLASPRKGREIREFGEEGTGILSHRHGVKVTVSISLASLRKPARYCSLRAAAGPLGQ